MPNALLDDLQDDDYREALASGNLKPRHRPLVERFTSAGYFAAIIVNSCACGSVSHTLSNIFHKETGDQGSSRSVALHLGHFPQIPPGQEYPITYVQTTTKVCASCVANYGFKTNADGSIS